MPPNSQMKLPGKWRYPGLCTYVARTTSPRKAFQAQEESEACSRRVTFACFSPRRLRSNMTGAPTKSASRRGRFFQSDIQNCQRQPADWTIGKLMVTGVVKWYDEMRGYGFIEPDDGGECLFVRRSEAQGNLFATLRENQRVAFEVEKGPEGNRTISVEIR